METVLITTAEGIFTAHFSDQGLARLNFPEAGSFCSSKEIPRRLAKPRLRSWVARTEKALATLIAGKPPRILPPLDLSEGTTFQQQVWRELLRIRPGETRSYAEIAALVGRPRAVRAVGQACGANPIPVLIPCHRVLASHGKLGGFSAGLAWKRKLLEREGLRF